MRILFLTPQPPYPPHAGSALRAVGLLEGLHTAGAKIDLLTFVDSEMPDPRSTTAADLCEQILAIPIPMRTISLRLRDLAFSGQADLIRRFWSPQAATELRALADHGIAYDAVQFVGLEMSVYLPLIQTLWPSTKLIYDAANAEFELQRRIFEHDRRNVRRLPVSAYSLVQWQRLQAYERDICRSVSLVIVTSQADADSLKALAPGIAVSIVPNGIYVNDYQQAAMPLDLGPNALLFTGSMSYRPNVDAILWFVDNILGQIREVVPEARLFVVGKHPHSRLEALRQREDVEITGYVQDINPFLHACAVFVAPLRTGSGTRLKLLQAMAARVAIVSTAIGAEGLEATSGREMLIADNAAAFAQSVASLLRDPAQRERMGEQAQHFVCEYYDWSIIIPRLLKSYRELGIG